MTPQDPAVARLMAECGYSEEDAARVVAGIDENHRRGLAARVFGPRSIEPNQHVRLSHWPVDVFAIVEQWPNPYESDLTPAQRFGLTWAISAGSADQAAPLHREDHNQRAAGAAILDPLETVRISGHLYRVELSRTAGINEHIRFVPCQPSPQLALF
jgi:hypothetical protein